MRLKLKSNKLILSNKVEKIEGYRVLEKKYFVYVPILDKKCSKCGCQLLLESMNSKGNQCQKCMRKYFKKKREEYKLKEFKKILNNE